MELVLSVNDPVSHTDENVIALARKVRKNSEIISVPLAQKLLPNGNCYWNAHHVAKKVGGDIVFGWILTQWPGSHITAMHHAVIRLKDGTYLDVTTPDHSEYKIEEISFIIDDSRICPILRLPAIGSIFGVTGNLKETTRFIETYSKLDKASKKLSEALYASGFRCEDRFETAAQNKQVMPKISSAHADKKLLNAVNNYNNCKFELGRSINSLKSKTHPSAIS